MLTPLGQMRDPVIVLTPVRSVDASGGETLTYTEGDPVFIALRPVTTSEGVKFGQVDADISHIAFGHWGDLSALGATQRIRMVEDPTQEFDIVGLPVNSPKRNWTRLHLVMRDNG